MTHEFSRTEMILGRDAMETLRGSTVLVFGAGGVGSHCIEALARCGVGRLILVDSDTVALSNINRQSVALHSTVGRHKTSVMRDRIADINPDAEVITFQTFVLPGNLEPLFLSIPGSVDYIVDAIDTVAAKLAIAEYAACHNLPLISSMGTGNKLHPELFEITDISKTAVCPLCRVMRRELKKRNIVRLKVLYSREEPRKPAAKSAEDHPGSPGTSRYDGRGSTPGSVSFVPPAAGLMIAGEVIRSLTGIS